MGVRPIRRNIECTLGVAARPDSQIVTTQIGDDRPVIVGEPMPVRTSTIGGARERGARQTGRIVLHNTRTALTAPRTRTAQEVAAQIRQGKRGRAISGGARVVGVADDRIQVGVRCDRQDLAFAFQIVGGDGVERPRNDLADTALRRGGPRGHTLDDRHHLLVVGNSDRRNADTLLAFRPDSATIDGENPHHPADRHRLRAGFSVTTDHIAVDGDGVRMIPGVLDASAD